MLGEITERMLHYRVLRHQAMTLNTTVVSHNIYNTRTGPTPKPCNYDMLEE